MGRLPLDGAHLELKQHQREALDALQAMRDQHETIALLHHATGTGKTVTAVMDAKAAAGERSFWPTPRSWSTRQPTPSQKILTYFHPAFTLGLTATPERTDDNRAILDIFKNSCRTRILMDWPYRSTFNSKFISFRCL